mmetsp:Transcript_37100/g.57528  ORF Transcript_37100/g.57528 Transcript_37100/m.57528 type:complete len:209 (+) Transcript_37100:2896-3522(+)
MVHGNLDRLCLSSTGLSRHKDRLIPVLERKSLVRSGRSLIDVRLYQGSRVSFDFVPDQDTGVSVSDLLGVNFFEPLEGIHRNNDITGTGVRFSEPVTFLKVVQDGSFVQKWKFNHILENRQSSSLNILHGKDTSVVVLQRDFLVFHPLGASSAIADDRLFIRILGHLDLCRLGVSADFDRWNPCIFGVANEHERFCAFSAAFAHCLVI